MLPNGTSTTGNNGVAGNNAGAGSTGSADSQRTPVPAAQGAHVFKSGQFTATAYSCTRYGSRVLCDFDVTRQSSAETNQQIWNQMILVDDGGKISHRHDAYYVFDDGTQGNNAYLTAKPVRMIMEFDDVSANASSATLAVGQDRADSIPITSNDTTGGGETQETAQAPAALKTSSGGGKMKSH
jgi:hypothetical protein